LGAGLPPNAVVIVDPDRAGTTMGYRVAPEMAVNIDELDAADVAADIGAVFP
jgi:hypothetical protein